jgi:DHA1 family inner membrane transport protein
MPDGIPAAVLLSFLATAGFFYVNIMPAIVTGLIDGLHLSARDAGRVGSANVYGAAVGALLAVWLAARVRWRPLALLLLCAMVALDLVSMGIRLPLPLICARFAHGVFGGALVGTSFSLIARTSVPERTFGMLLVTQFGIGGLGVMYLPRLVPLYGAQVLFLCLAAFSLVTLCVVPFLPDYPVKAAAARDVAAEDTNAQRVLLGVALLAVFLFQGGNMALTAYIIELGRAYGLATDHISATLGLANWIGASGSILVIAIGLKWGRLRPLLAALAVSVCGTAALHLSANGTVFAAANIVTAIAWSFGIPYLLGLCASFDRHGRAATLAGFCSKMGLASGPLAASVLLSTSNWSLLINLAAVALAASGLFAFLPAARLDRGG